jgi:hypothetical protein
MRRGEVWGSNAKNKPLVDYFVQMFEETRLCDAMPMKLVPTWKNSRVGEEGVSKRLDSVA